MRTMIGIRGAGKTRSCKALALGLGTGLGIWLGGVALAPAQAQDAAQWMAQIEEIVRRIAAENVRMETYLAYFDQVNRVQVAGGSLGAADADQRLKEKAGELFYNSYTDSDLEQLLGRHRDSVQVYFAGIEQAAAGKGGSALAQVKATLESLRRQYESWLPDRLDPLPILEEAARLATQMTGKPDPFAGQHERIMAALPEAVRRIVDPPMPGEMAGATAATTGETSGSAQPIPGETGGGTTASAIPATPPATPADSGGLRDFAWLGKQEDMVSAGYFGQPDGKPDAAFRLTFDFPAETEIRSIALYAADAQGRPAGNQVWHSEDSQYSVLVAVRRDLGVQLNWAHVGSLGTFQGAATYDIYVNDTGVFNGGQSFVVEVMLADGGKLARLAQIGGGTSTAVAAASGSAASGAATASTTASTTTTTTPSSGGTTAPVLGSATPSTQSATTAGATGTTTPSSGGTASTVTGSVAPSTQTTTQGATTTTTPSTGGTGTTVVGSVAPSTQTTTIVEGVAEPIAIITATYGRSCGAEEDNAYPLVAEACEDRTRCDYKIQPPPGITAGCKGDFDVIWICGEEPEQHRLAVKSKAKGTTVTLECKAKASGQVVTTTQGGTSGSVVASTATPPSPPAGEAGAIVVWGATYGGNCGAEEDNALDAVGDACDGKIKCDYKVDKRKIKDPKPGCAKDLQVTWVCGEKEDERVLSMPPGVRYGTVVPLSCAESAAPEATTQSEGTTEQPGIVVETVPTIEEEQSTGTQGAQATRPSTSGQTSVAIATPPGTTQERQSCTGSFAGLWHTTYGPMRLVQPAEGMLVGTFAMGAGRVQGVLNGRTFNGQWTDNYGSGRIQVTLAPDARSFSGTWARETGRGNPGGVWDGKCLSDADQRLELAVDRPGQDLLGLDVPAADPAICLQACEANTACKAFTYISPGVQSQLARCWLKSAVPQAVASDCCVSGVIPGR